jgi:2,3,4,5-tetrahydropyridine-2-carboxylate N-succinyltransferase
MATKPASKKAPARTTTTKTKTAAKAPAVSKSAPAKKAVAKRSPVEKVVAKKAAAKRVTKPVVAKTAPAKKAVAKKAVAQKNAVTKAAAAKKAVAKTAAVKKIATTKPAVKKVAVNKAVVNKAAASKAAAAKRAIAKPAPAVATKPVAKKAVRSNAAPRISPALRKLQAELKAMPVEQLQQRIEAAFDARAELTAKQIKSDVAPLVNRIVDGLESGEFRVAQPLEAGGWQVNEWLKKAVLLYFRINDMVVTNAGPAPFWDKVEARFAGYTAAQFREAGVRVVPGAIARRGTHFGKDVVLMPSFTNIGAHVGEGTMVDTWATVGSCAQIGKHCHLSGGAGIGGVLEPLQASPTIIEDHCFIGARSEVVEGVIVGHHSVIGMGVFLSQSTRIYNRATGEVSYGYVPPYSVVVSGSLPSKDGSHSLYCAVIVKQVDEKTIGKTSINDLLRGLAD